MLRAMFCLGIHTHTHINMYLCMYIYSKSLKENVVILKTHFVLVVTSEKVSGGIIVERGKQLAMLHFQS